VLAIVRVTELLFLQELKRYLSTEALKSVLSKKELDIEKQVREGGSI